MLIDMASLTQDEEPHGQEHQNQRFKECLLCYKLHLKHQERSAHGAGLHHLQHLIDYHRNRKHPAARFLPDLLSHKALLLLKEAMVVVCDLFQTASLATKTGEW